MKGNFLFKVPSLAGVGDSGREGIHLAYLLVFVF